MKSRRNHLNQTLCAATLGGIAAGLFLRRLAPRGGVALVDPGRLSRCGTRWASHGEFTWGLGLQPSGEQGTRLIRRMRARFGPRQLRPLFVPLFYPGEAVIPRLTLHGIQARAERTTRISSLEFNDGNHRVVGT